MYALFLWVLFNSDTKSVINFQTQWTDSTTVHSFFITVSESSENPKTIELNLTFKNDDRKNIFLNAASNDRFFMFDVVRNSSDSLLSITEKKSESYQEIPIARYELNKFKEGKISALLTYSQLNDGSNRLVPANNFNPAKDTVNFLFYTQFLKSKDRSRFGYKMSFINSNSDTVLSFYKKIQDELYTCNKGKISANKFASGKYRMHLSLYKNNAEIFNKESNDFYILSGVSNEKKSNNFQVSNQNYKALFQNYTSEELDILFDQAGFLSTDSEKKLYQNLYDLTAKKAFMQSFWEKRDSDENSNFDSFIAQLALVNKLYGSKSKAGYKTDRGRILMKYGNCEDIYTSSQSAETRPYEVWYYNNIQNGVYFFFVDLNGFGDYKLVHSTAINEINNPMKLYELGIDQTDYRK